jgi:MoaA/NifB/PqqE/SkfB family radical SAM enzyme
MLDINFYMKFDEIRTQLESGQIRSGNDLYEALETIRSLNPVVYNIETTNRCNMRCQMCPRTSLMTRPIEDLSLELFANIISQISPHDIADWKNWKTYCENKYGIYESDSASENHFFLYIISKVIQLHGYGDPLLDKNMNAYIAMLDDDGFDSYFSCNPANINLCRTYEMMESGLSYIKYSVESVNSINHNVIRGDRANIASTIKNIMNVIEYKEKHRLKTTIVITMIDLNKKNQYEEYQQLKKTFGGVDVYIYLKSEDCQWLRQDYHENKSIHWNEPCKHPWMTMTIKSNGDTAMCMEDYNNEIVFGNVKDKTLYDIWNGGKYAVFRKNHITIHSGMRCSDRCDMSLVGRLLA